MLRAVFSSSRRMMCSGAGKTEGERRLAELLKGKIEGTRTVEVEDVSNGCGSMYSIFVEATSFKGLTKVAQHKQITGILKAEIADMHGLTINTKVAKE